MFARPGFANKRANAPLSATNPVPVEALPNVHDEATQDIQGGAEGERFHLTQQQHDDLIYRLEHPLYAEPVTDAALVNVSTASGSLVIIQVET